MSHYQRRPRERSDLYTKAMLIADEDQCSHMLITVESEFGGERIVLEHCRLEGAVLPRAPHLRMRNCEPVDVDAANSDMEHSGWKGVSVTGSRFTGARLNGSIFAHVCFKESRLNMTQLQHAKLRGVVLENCDLREAYFIDSDIEGTVFAGSDLSGADFTHAQMFGCDLRRANIEGIRIAPNQLRGVIVTPDQALYLAMLLGVDIRE